MCFHRSYISHCSQGRLSKGPLALRLCCDLHLASCIFWCQCGHFVSSLSSLPDAPPCPTQLMGSSIPRSLNLLADSGLLCQPVLLTLSSHLHWCLVPSYSGSSQLYSTQGPYPCCHLLPAVCANGSRQGLLPCLQLQGKVQQPLKWSLLRPKKPNGWPFGLRHFC